MKNQYFGDKRDLFKFDLLLDLMASGRFEQLTYVPMLTKFDPLSAEGKLIPRTSGKYGHGLFEFLSAIPSSTERDVRLWRRYFADQKRFLYHAFRDDSDGYTFDGRKDYFRSIEANALRRACVFLDPDIGIERGSPRYMKRSGLDKYLFLDDLKELIGRCEDSVVIVYQHLQHDAGKRLGDIKAHLAVACDELGVKAVPFVRQNDLGFYAVATDEALLREVARAFSSHAEKHARLRQHVTDSLFVVKELFGAGHDLADLAVFGSVARGEQTRDSDIDVIASFAGPATLRGYFDLQHRIELSLGRKIDLVTSKAVRSEMRRAIEGEALRAA
jgi:predicted nucleotidyltransferase